MAALRAPGGCPWDREQTLDSLQPFLVEEAYEVLDVMAGDDPALHAEELGDLLFQIVFHAQIRSEAGHFDLADVVTGITEKLTRRHPHVFADEDAADPAAVEARWEELKAQEGKGGIDDIPKSLPALSRAAKVGKKASKVGFDWPTIEGPLSKVDEELAELRAALVAGDKEAIGHELGDLLFAVVNVARHAKVDPEGALRATNERFLDRFAHVRHRLWSTGQVPSDVDLTRLGELWDEAKARS
jgi:MazG family protein